jgi:hypothetical protein
VSVGQDVRFEFTPSLGSIVVKVPIVPLFFGLRSCVRDTTSGCREVKFPKEDASMSPELPVIASQVPRLSFTMSPLQQM